MFNNLAVQILFSVVELILPLCAYKSLVEFCIYKLAGPKFLNCLLSADYSQKATKTHLVKEISNQALSHSQV